MVVGNIGLSPGFTVLYGSVAPSSPDGCTILPRANVPGTTGATSDTDNDDEGLGPSHPRSGAGPDVRHADGSAGDLGHGELGSADGWPWRPPRDGRRDDDGRLARAHGPDDRPHARRPQRDRRAAR